MSLSSRRQSYGALGEELGDKSLPYGSVNSNHNLQESGAPFGSPGREPVSLTRHDTFGEPNMTLDQSGALSSRHPLSARRQSGYSGYTPRKQSLTSARRSSIAAAAALPYLDSLAAPPGLPPAPPEGLEHAQVVHSPIPLSARHAEPMSARQDERAQRDRAARVAMTAQQQTPSFTEGAAELFKPHGKRLDELPAWKNLKMKAMLTSARQSIREGSDLPYERTMLWTEVTHEPYGTDLDSKIRALLKLGFPPSVLTGLRDEMQTLDDAVTNDDEYKGDKYSAAVTKVQQLLGLKGETSELLLTTRALDPLRVMENTGAAQTFPDTEDQGEKMKTGSLGKPVVTYTELLDNILVFTPVTPLEDKLDLLIEMFDSGEKESEYISMDDVFRMLTWIRKEVDYSGGTSHRDVVDVMYQRLIRDYQRALREESWTHECEEDTHPDEILLAQMNEQGMHRFVLEQVLLSSERGGMVHFKPGTEVIVQNVKSKDLNGRTGKVVKKDPRQKGFMIVHFPAPLGDKHLKYTNLRSAPGAEKQGDVSFDAWGMYANLCLNIRPRMESNPSSVPLNGWIRVMSWVKRHVRAILYLSSVVTIFGLTFYFRYFTVKDVRDMFGAGAAISGSAGWVIKWSMTLVMISGCSGVMRLLPARVRVRTEDVGWVHISLVAALGIFVLVHICAAADFMHTITQNDPEAVNAVLDSSFPINSTITTYDVMKTIPAVTGLAMLGLILILAMSSCFSRESWIFYLIHKLYIPIVVLMVIHPMEGWLEWKYGSLVWMSVPFAVVLLEYFLDIKNRNTFTAEEVVTIKGFRGNVTGLEFRVKRPEAGMVRQQAGEYVQVMVEGVASQWRAAAVVTAPEIEDELVRLQVMGRSGSDWLKKAEDMIVLGRDEVKRLKIRGPLGLAACDIVEPLSRGGDGKVLLVANNDGLLHITSIMQDFCQSLSRPDDHVRRRVSRLHPIIEEFVKSKDKKLELHIVAVCKALEGQRRFMEAVLTCLDLHNTMSGVEILDYDTSKTSKITLAIHVTNWIIQGSGVDCWKRMKKLGSLKRHEGRKDERHDCLMNQNIKYGPPDWDAILTMARYRWIDCKVDVIHYGDTAHADVLSSACKEHSFDPSRPHLRPYDKTQFRFHRGETIPT
eukprot:TRINITY_DN19734_c0_g1_i1.p1 TRINITY_DN19734_c0_g1~~TRINITY_DN19734_c0_g1_i1.p1  ORF type:complete len:1132 (+),score=349.57 TRINITY_DN19734_c0_g1_i1:96-3491(+)